MFGIKKRKILIWSVIISSVLLQACQPESDTVSDNGLEISGNTQGTTYSIIISESDVSVSKSEIDSLFEVFDSSLSTYIDNSVISKINKTTDFKVDQDPSGLFKRCYELSQEVYKKTDGAFDPSVFPLVSGWGFMKDMETPLSQPEVDSIMRFVSFEEHKLHSAVFVNESIHFRKVHPSFMLDFNAVAQGLSVDVVAEYLDSKGLTNYYIEVGGEIVTKGKNREGENWKIGIDVPLDNLLERELENIVHLSNKAIATSGNYRKYYVVDGTKYAHTLNPKTGFPVQHSLLSASVIADNCGKADAYATAFMVIGMEAAIQFVEDHPEEGLEVYLLYTDERGELRREMSNGFSKLVEL